MYFILCNLFNFGAFLLISSFGKPVSSFVYDIFYYVVAGKTNLMSISDGLDPYFFRRKMEKVRSMKEEKDGQVFISRQSRHCCFIDIMIKVFFPIRTLNWRVNNLFPAKEKALLAETKILSIIIK